MKRLLLIALMMLPLVFIMNAKDKVVKRNGEVIEVEIKKSTPEIIEFTYPNEDVVNELSKKTIKEIVYSSGRVETCNTNLEIPVIESEKDWEKVIVTYLESDVKGLTRVKDLKATSGWGGAMGSSLGYNNAVKSLKKQAAKLKAPILLITDMPNKEAAARGGGVKVVGVAYK